MFKVLYFPYEGVEFWRSGPEEGSPAVLAYVRPAYARVLICIDAARKEEEVPILESVAKTLNCSPSLEFTRLTLRSIKEAWQADLLPAELNLMRTLRFASMFKLDERQPSFAPNNGSRLDGYW